MAAALRKGIGNRVVLITGATGDIGGAIATAFAQAGGRLFLAGRNQERGESLCAALRGQGVEVALWIGDLQERSACDRMIRECKRVYGSLDIACNSLGISGPFGVPLTDYPEEDWRSVMSTNLDALFFCMKAEIRLMSEQGTGGAIVNLASIAGLRAFPGSAAYTASKFAVVGLTQSTALEVAKLGIRVNALCPGLVAGRMSEDAFAGGALDKEIASSYPLQRLASPEEVAQAALWLASDDASYVSGCALPVDGGRSLA